MYTLVNEAVAWIEVTWKTLDIGSAEEASVQVERSIRLKVAFLPHSEFMGMLNGKVDGPVADVARRVTRDWSGVVDEDKRAVPFSTEMLTQILEHEPGFVTGFELSFIKASLGQGKEREKNSVGSPGDGRAEKPQPRKPRRSKSS